MKIFIAFGALMSGSAVVMRSYQGLPIHCAFDALCFVGNCFLLHHEHTKTFVSPNLT